VFVVDYSFQETGGRERRERQELAEDLASNSNGQVTIEYIPGLTGYSRIQGRPIKWLWGSLVFGSIGALMNGFMAWLTWKRKDAKPTATKPVPRQLASVQRAFTGEIGGGGIVGLVILGAILIGVSLFGVFGEAGGLVVFAVLGVGVLLFYFEMTSQATKQHTESMQTIARNLDLKFSPEGHEELHQSLKRFHLATLGSYSKMTNLMYGQHDGTDIAIFEYQYWRGKNNIPRQTVIWMQRRGTRMTKFSLRPEDMWNQIGGWFGHEDINFESHPQFSRDYLLRGDDDVEPG
jgi:hypothetical protein